MNSKRKILFLQDFSLARKGGGASIIKRLQQYSSFYNYEASTGIDRTSNSGIILPPGEKYFDTLPRNFRFGIGRLAGCLTILCLDVFSVFSVKKLIREENPDIIHVLAHGISFPVAALLAKRSGKTVVLSVHDLWHWTVSGYIPKKMADRIFKKAMQGIETVYVISVEMKAYLADKYGPKNYQVIHDGIIEQYQKNTVQRTQTPLALFYAGTMHHMQMALFTDLLAVLDTIVSDTVKIGICSNKNYVPEKKYNHISIVNYGWLNENDLRLAGSAYTYGILPLSFEKEDTLFYQTSLMTKIPFYMSIGLPIICIGPPNASAIRLVQHEGIGITISSPGKKEMFNNLTFLLQNRQVYSEYIYNIDHAAQNTFNMKTIATRFYKNLLPEVMLNQQVTA